MRKLLKYPKAVVITCLMITVVLGIQLKNLKLDNSVRQFMPKKDPSYLRMLDTENQFGSMITTGVALETNGKTILTPEYLDLIDRLTKRFESIESVESVESLTNIEYIQGVDGSLVAGTLLGDDYTGSENDIASIKEKLASWGELYDRVIISDDQRATQIQITFKKGGSEEQKQEMLNSIHKILEEETTGRNLVVKVYGDPVISEQARIFMLKDLRYLIPLVVIVVLLTLLFSFGTVDGTVLPLLTVLMSTVWAVGLMAVFKQTFSIVSS
ncbi:MAG: MMPL family transporter, partial [Sphaerochaetaceae bacterium]